MKKILFINKGGLYPFHRGGAEETMDQFLKMLHNKGILCYSINCKENYHFSQRSHRQIVNTSEVRMDIFQKIFYNSKRHV